MVRFYCCEELRDKEWEIDTAQGIEFRYCPFCGNKIHDR